MGSCGSKNKSSGAIKKITPLSPRSTVSLKSALLRCKIKVVNKEELTILQLLFRDLTRRCSKDTLNKEIFSLIFSLPGLLGERLFSIFDTKKTRLLDLESFLNGIANYTKSTIANKQRMIYDICDINDDLILDSSDLYILQMLGIEVINIEKLKNFEFQEAKLPTNKRTKFSHRVKNPTTTKEKLIKSCVLSLISTYGEEESINFEEFQAFLKENPAFFKCFDEVFNEKLWNSDLLNDTLTPFPEKSFKISQLSGQLFIKSEEKLISKHGILRDKVLLLYSDINSKTPEELFFMIGCHVEITGDFYTSNKFGIYITHQSPTFNEFSLWSDSRKARDEWLKVLESASKVRRFKEHYAIGDKIGHGKFSDVYVCTEHKDYKKWAVKVITKSKLSVLEKDLLQSELSILRVLDHPNIVKVKEVFDSKKHILVVMELMEGGELFDRINKKKVFSEYATSRIVGQLLEAVKYLHSIGVMHRDIKPENVLLSDQSDIPIVKLADFGLAKLSGPNYVQNLACGTLGYVAPEVLSQAGYNHKADIWSIGVITYLMLRGRLPFDHKEKQVLIELTLKASLNFEEIFWKSFTPYASEFLKTMLKKKPIERSSAEEALSNNWIKNADILIPRAIDKRKMEEMLIDRGVSSAYFGSIQYRELSLSEEIENSIEIDVKSMPDLLETSGTVDKFVEEDVVLVNS